MLLCACPGLLHVIAFYCRGLLGAGLCAGSKPERSRHGAGRGIPAGYARGAGFLRESSGMLRDVVQVQRTVKTVKTVRTARTVRTRELGQMQEMDDNRP